MIDLKSILNAGAVIVEENISLPTSGAEILRVDFVTDAETNCRTGDFYRISGIIHPKDSNALDISFQAGFPVNWNGKVLQYGGGGIDGWIMPIEKCCLGQAPDKPSPLSKGYVCFMSDGGHQMDPKDPWNCEWALNQESLENFAYASLKKAKDAVVALIIEAYGKEPEKVYIVGGSNGGRECLKSIQNFPEDYDGAICLFPVLYWVSKILKDSCNGTMMDQLGADAWMDTEQFKKVQECIMEMCDGLDGAEDGIISNLPEARKKRSEIREELLKNISASQLAALDGFAAPFAFPFPLGYGQVTLPGYDVFSGAPLIGKNVNWFGSSADKRDEGSVIGGNNLIRCMVLKDKNYDLSEFNTKEHQKELQEVSKLLDAYDTDFDRYRKHGGKILLMHGMADSLVPVEGTENYYLALMDRYGKEELGKFLKFYMVPGYGHGYEGTFLMDIDLISILDGWVTSGKEPDVLVARDQNDQVHHRTRPLYQYPFFAVYNGEGDINDAGNFHPES